MSYTSLRTLVADVLRTEIERNELAPGDRLLELHVAKRLGVSQAPVREALRVLESEGLVEHVPRRGVYVKRISAREIEEIYTMRAAVEGMAARRAMRLMTEQDRAEMQNTVVAMELAARESDPVRLIEAALELHEVIALTARHARLYKVWQTIALQTRRFAQLHGRFDDPVSDNGVEQHVDLIRALDSGDPDLAEQTMKAHVREAGHDLLRYATEAGMIEPPTAGGIPTDEWSVLVWPEELADDAAEVPLNTRST